MTPRVFSIISNVILVLLIEKTNSYIKWRKGIAFYSCISSTLFVQFFVDITNNKIFIWRCLIGCIKMFSGERLELDDIILCCFLCFFWWSNWTFWISCSSDVCDFSGIFIFSSIITFEFCSWFWIWIFLSWGRLIFFFWIFNVIVKSLAWKGNWWDFLLQFWYVLLIDYGLLHFHV